MAEYIFYLDWVYFIFFEDLNQKIIYLLVTSFDIYKPNITKPITIITINCGMIGVTI